MIEGLDVSYYQNPKDSRGEYQDIDWRAVAGAGKRFVIVRLGDGAFRDPMLERNVAGGVGVDLRAETYHYLRFALEPMQQAQLVIERLEDAKALGAASRVWLDWEDTSGAAQEMTVAERLAWMAGLMQYLGQASAGSYSAGWWWNPYMAGAECPTAAKWVAGGPFYDTGYPSDPTADGYQPSLPAGWNDWLVWQYTSKGRVPGIQGYVDLDVAKDEFLEEGDDMGLTTQDMVWVILNTGLHYIKGSGPTIYNVNQKGKRPYPGGHEDFSREHDWDEVIELDDDVLTAIPDAP